MSLKNITKLKVGSYFTRYYSASSKLVDLKIEDKTGHAILEMQRPPVNALNLELLSDLLTSLKECEKNKCRGLIMTSKSDGIFSAGLDILEMYKPDLDRLKKFWTVLQDVWIHLYGTSFPTVALINGHSPAGGCLLACSAEYRVMYKNFQIGLNETKLGIVAPFWFVDSITNVVGFREAEKALTAGHMFTSEEALKVGLVDELIDNKEEGYQKAEAFFKRFSGVSPLARTYTKNLIRGETISKLIKLKEQDIKQFVDFAISPKVQESIGIYLENLKNKSASKKS